MKDVSPMRGDGNPHPTAYTAKCYVKNANVDEERAA